MEYGDDLHTHKPRGLVRDKKCNISRMARAQKYYFFQGGNCTVDNAIV